MTHEDVTSTAYRVRRVVARHRIGRFDLAVEKTHPLDILVYGNSPVVGEWVGTGSLRKGDVRPSAGRVVLEHKRKWNTFMYNRCVTRRQRETCQS